MSVELDAISDPKSVDLPSNRSDVPFISASRHIEPRKRRIEERDRVQESVEALLRMHSAKKEDPGRLGLPPAQREQRLQIEKIGDHGEPCPGNQPIDLPRLSGRGAVHRMGPSKHAAAGDGQMKALLHPASRHRPVVEHSSRGDEVGPSDRPRDAGDGRRRRLPDAIQVNHIGFTDELPHSGIRRAIQVAETPMPHRRHGWAVPLPPCGWDVPRIGGRNGHLVAATMHRFGESGDRSNRSSDLPPPEIQPVEYVQGGRAMDRRRRVDRGENVRTIPESMNHQFREGAGLGITRLPCGGGVLSGHAIIDPSTGRGTRSST